METTHTSQQSASTNPFPPWDSQHGRENHHIPTRLDDIVEDEEWSAETNGLRQSQQPKSRDQHGKDGRKEVDASTSHAPDAYTDLTDAIRNGDIAFVKSQLEMGVQSTSPDGDDESFIVAVLEDQIEIAEMLLQNADTCHRPAGLPLLVHATMSPSHGPRLLQRLLNMGFPLNAVSGPQQKNVLHWAASKDKVAAVEFLLSRGMDIEATCSEGRSPLALAAEAGHINVVKVLWAHGASLEAKGHGGTTPLMWAACRGHVAVLKFFLEKGAQVDSRDQTNNTALSLASHYGHEEAVKVLLDAGADINIRCTKPEGCTPVMAAACENSVGVLHTLISRGADLNLRSNYGHTALDIALMEQHEDAAKMLLEAMGGGSYPTNSVSLQLALANSHSMIETIMTTASIMHGYMAYGALSDHAWISWVLQQGGTILKQPVMTRMLHVAMQERNLSMIKVLFDEGCDAGVYLQSGETCLSYAIRHREKDLIKLLLNAGADPNQETAFSHSDNYTPFHLAIHQLKDGRDTEVVDLLLASGRCLINKGKDVASTAISYVLSKAKDWAPGVADSLAIRMIDTVTNAEEDRDDTGSTLLHVAVEHQREDFVDLLLGRGMDIDVKGDKDFTPLLQACQFSAKMVKALINRGANLHAKFSSDAGALHAAASMGNVEVLELLLDCGMDIESQSSKGHTPLASALLFACEEAALYLLRRGASVLWSTVKHNHTALHYAARDGLAQVVEILLSKEVDVNALSTRGWSPLHEACSTGRSPAIVKALVDAGADMEIALPNGNRPLHIALNCGDQLSVLTLLDCGADIHARDSQNRSLLHIAAAYNLPLVVKEVLVRDPSQIEQVDDSFRTPLCLPWHIELVELLLKHGANANHADKDGWTPLHQAVYNDMEETALVLIRAGATLDARTTDDELTVLERATDMEKWDLDGRQQNTLAVSVLVEARVQKLVEEHEKGVKRAQEDEVLKRKKSIEELDGLDGGFELVGLEEGKVA